MRKYSGSSPIRILYLMCMSIVSSAFGWSTLTLSLSLHCLFSLIGKKFSLFPLQFFLLLPLPLPRRILIQTFASWTRHQVFRQRHKCSIGCPLTFTALTKPNGSQPVQSASHSLLERNPKSEALPPFFSLLRLSKFTLMLA